MMTNRNFLAGASALTMLAAAPALAQNNTSSISQTGNSAAATVEQVGANDRSQISQSGGGTVNVDQNGVTGSTSTVTTSADDRPPESTVDVTQSDDGSSSADAGQANVSTVVQDNVNGFGSTGSGSTVRVTQTHNADGAGQNSSNVQQGRNATSSQVTVDQSGGDNTSTYGSFTSNDNDANISQTGLANKSDVSQNFQGRGALAVVTQNGTGGATNDVFIDQISSGFSANPAEFALGAEARATQNGEGNTSTISQTGFSDMMSEGNFASSSQQGDDNSSSIDQSGIDNMATVSQTGSGHGSIINQSGNMNTATVTQTAADNMSSVTQSGDGNTATVTQGGASGGNF